MIYRKKVIFLFSLVMALLLVYILSFIRDPVKGKRNFFAWLEPSFLIMVDRLEISGPQGMTILVRKNNVWFFNTGIEDLPVKQGRVEDFLTVLTRKEAYTARASSAEAKARLGLLDESATRITVRGGAGLPLLELLIGTGDALGREVYIQRAGRNEIFSGEDRFTFYTDATPASWFDLRLFPSSTSGLAEILSMVQQLDVVLPDSGDSYTLRRNWSDSGGSGWILVNDSGELDNQRVETWIRSILSAEAEDFSFEPPGVFEGSITLRMGNGTEIKIYAGPENDYSRSVITSESDHVYIFTEWTMGRLFREKIFFLK